MTATMTSEQYDPLLYDPSFIDPSLNTGLWWCKDAEDVFSVQINAFCFATGYTWKDLNQCADFIKQFPFIFVAMPPGSKRDEAVQELSVRFKTFLYIPKDEAWAGCSSIKDLRDKGGLSSVEKLILGCKEIPTNGLLDISTVTMKEEESRNRTFSGIGQLDRAINGFLGGQMTVWSSKRGEGKSTFLSQMIPEAVAQGTKVCMYSGEMPAADVKQTLCQQIAGRRYIYSKLDSYTGKELYFVKESVIPVIDKWLEGKVFITDIRSENAHDEDNIISLFEYAYRRFHCRMFIVDNIMTTRLKNEPKLGQWRAQSLLAERLKSFAQRFDVHVHLVAHPRKTKDNEFDADDVAGSADITNYASNIIRVNRIPEEKIAELGCTSGLRVLKNRKHGDYVTVKLDFDKVSKRFYPVGGTPDRKFDWEVQG